jgi:ABC-type arginine/histidine transport system permease subunit
MLRGTVSTIARGAVTAGEALEAVRAVNIARLSRPAAFIAALHEMAEGFERRLEQADV